MTRVATSLWFDGGIEEAAALYVSLMPGSEILHTSRYPDDAAFPGDMAGQALTVDMTIGGHSVTLLNGGPAFPLTEAVSLVLEVEGQAEIDRLWDALLEGGGRESQCGWLVDRFGLSWQIVPTAMGQLMSGPNAGAVTAALMTMAKIDVGELERASAGS
ncbi:VOC family protein [Agrococcus jejuensis]|uniref:Glyoxalase superfamily enzyme, possibly 3-demethylubiquinone-9 3-methyltransferase n=1 Tax=Agrococcus jejuensis TaxID=399736 RepID=A0A1G8GDS9_9MICO|nr:VOC family protein [Agrococcus jejuensis]SDH92554.1 Glyoxalase superfamily enzyme, possibly 3-demethylubiquinone-9 3-methyltransferase [Agrococcus jejuensis]